MSDADTDVPWLMMMGDLSIQNFEPLTWVVAAKLFPTLPREDRIRARRLYRRIRRNLSAPSARRAVCYHVVLAATERLRNAG